MLPWVSWSDTCSSFSRRPSPSSERTFRPRDPRPFWISFFSRGPKSPYFVYLTVQYGVRSNYRLRQNRVPAVTMLLRRTGVLLPFPERPRTARPRAGSACRSKRWPKVPHACEIPLFLEPCPGLGLALSCIRFFRSELTGSRRGIERVPGGSRILSCRYLLKCAFDDVLGNVQLLSAVSRCRQRCRHCRQHP